MARGFQLEMLCHEGEVLEHYAASGLTVHRLPMARIPATRPFNYVMHMAKRWLTGHCIRQSVSRFQPSVIQANGSTSDLVFCPCRTQPRASLDLAPP